jgi:hypothetical protein
MQRVALHVVTSDYKPQENTSTDFDVLKGKSVTFSGVEVVLLHLVVCLENKSFNHRVVSRKYWDVERLVDKVETVTILQYPICPSKSPYPLLQEI